jgi:WD40 repeat protein
MDNEINSIKMKQIGDSNIAIGKVSGDLVLSQTNNTFNGYNSGEKYIIDSNSKQKAPLKLRHLKSPKELLNSININGTIQTNLKKYELDMRGFDFQNKTIEYINFSSVNMDKTSFIGTRFVNCAFSDVNLDNSDFNNCEFENVEFIHIDSFYSIAYNNNTRRLCVGGNNAIILFSADVDGIYQKSARLMGDYGRFLRLAWRPSKDDDLFLATTSNGFLTIWNGSNSETPLISSNDYNDPVYAADWNPTGNYIAVAVNKTQLKIYKMSYDEYHDSPYLEEQSELKVSDDENEFRHTKQILTLAWSPDNQWLVTSGIDKKILVWDVRNPSSPKLQRAFSHAHTDYVRRIVWSSNSKLFFSCSDDGMIRVWGMGNNNKISELDCKSVNPNQDNNCVLSLGINEKEKVIAAGLRDDQIALIKYSDTGSLGDKFYMEKIHKGRIWDLVWDKTGRFLITVGNEGKMKVGLYSESILSYAQTHESDFEVKISCANMKIHSARGLDESGYQISDNKDMPWLTKKGTLGEFLSAHGAVGYDK